MPCTGRNSICSLGGPIMLLAVAQQEDEVPTVRREAIAALVAVLEDDKRKVEVRLPPHISPALLCARARNNTASIPFVIHRMRIPPTEPIKLACAN